jgi:hypothetical protein
LNVADDSKNKNPSQEPSPAITEYFARIPYSLFDARERDELTGCMFTAMMWLYKWADWSTGTVRKFTAERLVWATVGEYAKRTFEEAIQNLVKAGWVRSENVPGSKKPYALTICNYLALSGALKNQIINHSEIKTWRPSDKEGRADNRADSAQMGRAEGYADGRADSATTMRDSKDSIRDLRDSDLPLNTGHTKPAGAQPADATRSHTTTPTYSEVKGAMWEARQNGQSELAARLQKQLDDLDDANRCPHGRRPFFCRACLAVPKN